jgi:hypothetical protein
MDVQFNLRKLDIIIRGCPVDYNRVIFNGCMLFKYHSDGTVKCKDCCDEDMPLLIDFLKCEELDFDEYLAIKSMLGFIPFYERNVNGENIYKPGLEFSTEEELTARQKPTVMDTVLGIQIPKAITNHMLTLTGLRSDFNEEITMDKFPKHIRPYVLGALKDISKGGVFNLHSMLVYDFLNMLDIFHGEPMFISGDELLLNTTANRIAAGYIDVQILYFTAYVDPHTDPARLTSGIIEVLPSYKKFSAILGDMNRIDSAVLNYILGKKIGVI